MISHKLKCVFPRIGKNASTTIINYFKQFDPNLLDEGHNMILSGIKRYIDNYSYSSCIKQYFKFAFVRNPYDRLYSAWHEFKKPDTFLGLKAKLNNDTIFNSFEKFIDYTLTVDHIHWKSQYSILYHNNNLLVDYVGKVENIDIDLRKICSILSIPYKNNIPKDNASINKSNKLITNNIKNIIYNKYKNDFIYFHYDR